jgi:hypothetical protein
MTALNKHETRMYTEQLARSSANMLEFMLETYESLCKRKRQSKRELDRHEAILLRAFEPIIEDLRDFLDLRFSLGVRATARDYPRLSKVLAYTMSYGGMPRAETPEQALHRYFGQSRHGKPEWT